MLNGRLKDLGNGQNIILLQLVMLMVKKYNKNDCSDLDSYKCYGSGDIT